MNYNKQKSKIFFIFKKIIRKSSKKLINKYSIDNYKDLENDFIKELSILLPKIPYVGGKKNPFTKNLIGTTYWLAIYKVLKRKNWELVLIADFIDITFKIYLNQIPGFIMKIQGKKMFKKRYIEDIKIKSKESKKMEYKDSWILEYIESDGKSFEYGIDYNQCTIHKMYIREGAYDILPYICKHDFYVYEKMGVKLTRTMTLADNKPICNFRFSR